jgi:rieske iron-sulfur protein
VSNIEGKRPHRPWPLGRRTVLKAALGAGLVLPPRVAGQALDPKEERPQENDRLVFALGSRVGEVIAPEDVPLGGPQLFAYPMDPATGVVRDGSRLNQVILVRLDPMDLTSETHARAAGGIVAYSGVCSHTGCDVNAWRERTQTFLCKCHDSEFDPADAARVDFGPAPRRLAALPLKIVDGALVAAGSFIGRVGAAKQ